jgi:hypothetical protein
MVSLTESGLDICQAYDFIIRENVQRGPQQSALQDDLQ